jgi:c(7)-type cytochrome triheme protein
MTNKRAIIFSVTLIILLSCAGISHSQQKLNSGMGEQFPRSDITSNYKAASKEVIKAREESALPPHLQFNRLHKPSPAPHLSPEDDGLHDASLGSVQNELLPPTEGMKGLPPANYGNKIDWVKALENGDVKPVTKISDDQPIQPVADFEILIPAVGFIPDVIFPHKPHTQWLTCSNCHVSQTFDQPVFLMVAGKNPITMAEIAEGKWCGLCHSGKKEKVAFPISDCVRCHSGPLKTEPTSMKSYMIKAASTLDTGMSAEEEIKEGPISPTE